jgi:hypothetical protein
VSDYDVMNPDGPYRMWAAIAPSDSVDLSFAPKSLYVGGAGNLVLRDQFGNDVTFTAVPVGAVLRVSPRRVLSTGTTATGIVGLR